MIQNLRHADQGDSGTTDATRTERGFTPYELEHPQVSGRMDRRQCAPCKTVGFAFPGSNPGPATTSGNAPWPAYSAIFQTVGSGAVSSHWVQRSPACLRLCTDI